MNVLGISGSLRAGSFNTMALRAAQQLAPAGMTISVAELSQVPLFNDDVRATGLPGPVVTLKEQVRAADAVLLVSPEYNFSVPGVLKNALDWLSRPPEPPFDGKTVAIMGASTGVLGTARGQYHLRQVLLYMNTFTLNKPEVFINQAAAKFNAQGELTDEPTRKIIGEMLLALQSLKARVG